MKQKFLLLIITLGLYAPIFAENKSTNKEGVISSIRGRVTSPKLGKVAFFFDQELRSTTDFGSFKDSRSALCVAYAPLSWLKVAGGYVFMAKGGSNGTSIGHRFLLAAEGTMKLSNFSFTLRERLVSTSANGYLLTSSDEAKRVNLLRTRLKIKYKTACRTTPYIYTELYNQTNESMLLTRVRSQMGAEIKISDVSTFTAFYQYAHYTNVPSSTAPHTIGVMYSYKFANK